MSRVALSLAVVALLVGSVVGPAAAAATQPAVGDGARATTDTIHLTQRLALTPDEPGRVDVTLRFRIPDRVGRLSTQVPADATVTDRSGFDVINDTHYEWTDGNDIATITYELPVNETISSSGPGYASTDAHVASQSADEGYLLVDAGDWALVRRPSTPVQWASRGEVTFSRTVETKGPGAAGEVLVFLGEHETVYRAVNGQQFELVVPAAASMEESPDDILTAMAQSSRAMSVNDRDDHVFIVAAPSVDVEWAVRGLQTGPSDFWVEDGEQLNRTNSAWLHEYVHTRQAYAPSREVRWVTEGGATYYATLLALQQERIPFSELAAFLDIGRKQYGDAVLSDPSAWAGNGNYFKGALVMGELDRRIRLASDGDRTFQRVFRAMNDADSKLTQERFLDATADAGDDDVRDAAQRYTVTSDTPHVWTREQHDEAFGALPAATTQGFAAAEPFSVDGPYRSGPLDSSPNLTVVPGEEVTVTTSVSNDGGRPLTTTRRCGWTGDCWTRRR
ncbi:hypothetical protein VB773_04650 [Haloarculaceae archaeon H-GB2-1]|nr:hypothetical protein [Haloarculaceae archaeon H-GB11]MEA5406940.1 hypothetical protein [Haloarculaceae archaeon H-GB2-1]